MRRIFQNGIENKLLVGQKGFAPLAYSIDSLVEIEASFFLVVGLWKDMIVFT